MKEFIDRLRALIRAGDVRISDHGYDELIEDGLTAREVLDGIADSMTIEEYPDYPKGHCVLTLQMDKNKDLIHVVWGIPKGLDRPAVMITARPDPERWDQSFTRRR